ncbi:MAG: nitrogen fixation protein NifU [Pseudomonadota bacterium]|nr:nitrogen fixation protein NifU [Pseudomonadota bacterium]
MLELSAAAREHFTHPRHAGQWLPETPGIATAWVELPTSGEVLQLQLRIENGVIVDARFKAYGCGWLIACGSLLMEQIIGQPLANAAQFRHHALVEELTAPPEKLHCAVLAETVLQKALNSPFTPTPLPVNEGRQ